MPDAGRNAVGIVRRFISVILIYSEIIPSARDVKK